MEIATAIKQYSIAVDPVSLLTSWQLRLAIRNQCKIVLILRRPKPEAQARLARRNIVARPEATGAASADAGVVHESKIIIRSMKNLEESLIKQ